MKLFRTEAAPLSHCLTLAFSREYSQSTPVTPQEEIDRDVIMVQQGLQMTPKNIRVKYLKMVAVVLALLLAGSNALLSTRSTTAQGIDLAGIDKSIDPGDDFFGHANGNWSKAAQIPSDRPSY